MEFNKKIIILILAIFLVGILAVGAASAADNSAGDIVGIDDSTCVPEVQSASALSATDDDDNLKINENNNVLTEKSKTFIDLNRTINGNLNRTIDLYDDYVYDDGTDSAYIEGIEISRELSIDGHGITIDESTVARIFKINTNDEITFKNITFINAKADYGSAIYALSGGGCTVINCIFYGSYATESGGAMSGGTAINCIFYGSYATESGGAMSGGTAINCTFSANTALSGGAMSGGTAINCTFSANTALSGGAMSGGTAIGCIFSDNIASTGSAMYKGKQYLCIFENNDYNNTENFTCESFLSVSNVIFAEEEDKRLTVYLTCKYENNEYLIDNFNTSVSIYRDGILKEYSALTGKAFVVDLMSGVYTANFTLKDFPEINLTGVKLKVKEGTTFSALNRTINGNTNDTIILDKNYTFYSDSDSAFTKGIRIDRPVTIIGNGHTINANGKARIFIFTSEDVVLENITFINGNTTLSGGAVYFNKFGRVINCNFTNNFVQVFDGGAIYGGSAVNCTFIKNTASEYGGAMRLGSAVNCTFINNSAGDGGAIFEVSAFNSIFKYNHARNNGGSMYGSGYSAIECEFINNTAKNGGATYQIIANNCQFINNTASEYGGAMYGGAANNCIFKDNKAGISGDDTYNTTLPKPIFSVSNFTSTYNSGDKLLFNFTTASGLPINNANITIRVYKNNALVGTYYALSGEGWVVSVSAGSYVAVCSVENQAYDVEPANAALTVSKDTTKLTASAVTTVYNGGKYLVATLKDSFGRPIKGVKITIKLSNGKTSTPPTDKNGQVKFSTNGLAPKKSYAATITFAGNGNYIKSTKSVKVTVKKATPKLTAKAKTFKKSVKTKKYSITLKTNQNKVMKNTKLTLKVNGKTYSAKTNAKGQATFKITKLTKKGKFTAVVKFAGNKYYNAKTVKPKIIVR